MKQIWTIWEALPPFDHNKLRLNSHILLLFAGPTPALQVSPPISHSVIWSITQSVSLLNFLIKIPCLLGEIVNHFRALHFCIRAEGEPAGRERVVSFMGIPHKSETCLISEWTVPHIGASLYCVALAEVTQSVGFLCVGRTTLKGQTGNQLWLGRHSKK